MTMNKETLLHYFQNYHKALSLLNAAIQLLDKESHLQNFSKETKELLKDGLIQRFEFTHELAWKTMKCYLEYNSYEVIVSGPLYMISKSLEIGLLSNIKWKDSIEFRKLISKINDKETIERICLAIKQDYCPLLIEFEQKMISKLKIL